MVAPQPERSLQTRAPWRVLLAAAIAAGVFLMLPGDLWHKTHLVLQGVCAQRPSHSFRFDGQPLPVDARMTGIYFGTASALGWCLLACRAQRSGRLTRSLWILVALGVVTMALDGLNSLASDLALPTPYASTNQTRVVTGLLAGVAVGMLLSHLVTLTLTHRPRGGWTPSGLSLFVPPLLLGASVCALAACGLPTLGLPLACMIVMSALATLWAMTSVLLTLVWRRAWGFASAQQRDETLAFALLGACALLVVLAVWRALLEQITGPMILS